MDAAKERRVLARLIWREQMRKQRPEIKDITQIRALWQEEKQPYIQLANRVINRAEKRGFKVSVAEAK